jgi:hypothetical protein
MKILHDKMTTGASILCKMLLLLHGSTVLEEPWLPHITKCPLSEVS